MNWWKLAEAILDTDVPDWDLLLQFEAFHVPRDLRTNSVSLQQFRTLSTTFGLGGGHVVSEYEALAPI
ncbi:MAG: hypothetical protein ACKPKO_39370, partial [Candidatus Fonsibacter sp.]